MNCWSAETVRYTHLPPTFLVKVDVCARYGIPRRAVIGQNETRTYVPALYVGQIKSNRKITGKSQKTKTIKFIEHLFLML